MLHKKTPYLTTLKIFFTLLADFIHKLSLCTCDDVLFEHCFYKCIDTSIECCKSIILTRLVNMIDQTMRVLGVFSINLNTSRVGPWYYLIILGSEVIFYLIVDDNNVTSRLSMDNIIGVICICCKILAVE